MTAEQTLRLPDAADRDQVEEIRPGAYQLLNRISRPADLRALTVDELGRLAAEIRELLITVVTRTGGHLGPNLGVVELTIALHRTFRSPWDPIVWDTGHQSYVHKLLTGRLGRFGELRQFAGLSGYPSRAESVHDLVENSHASTALSYADGLAKGLVLRGEHDRRVVAVIGDGAMTGGLSWEALNNIGAGGRPLVIVLNDNGRAYSPTVGSLTGHLGRLRDGRQRENLFRLLGLDYVGPVDGHDIGALEEALARARAADRPVVVHCVTRKGRGYAPAETDEVDRLHTVSPAPRPKSASTAPTGPAWTDVFSDAMLTAACRRDDLVGVTAAMPLPTGLGPMAERFPDRVYDVGIAEQHAVISAAGLAMAGLHPVVAIYSTFLNRAFDQVLMDVALHRLGITFVLDRAGITGPDGPSHHGTWDVGLLGLVPGLELAAPRDAPQLRKLFVETIAVAAPRAIRFPRGNAPAPMPGHGRVGRADLLTPPTTTAAVAILAVGPLCAAALAAVDRLATDGIQAEVADPRWLVADPALCDWAAAHRLVVTVEDDVVVGGFGERIRRALDNRCELVTLGLDAAFIQPGEREELLRMSGLDADGIYAAIRARTAA